MVGSVVVDLGGLLTEPAVAVFERAPEHRGELGCRQRFEAEERGARQQRPGEREERVLGGGSDEHQEPVFYVWEERVLLGAVEAVDLVEEEDRALALRAEPSSSTFHHLPNV